MPKLQQDTFEIFISHKHTDADLADLVAAELTNLDPDLIHCWVSGQQLFAGVDWVRQVKASLARSHLLVLLFTAPQVNWDWCLYEVGLFVRFEAEEVSSVACIYDPDEAPPAPLTHVQCVPADAEVLVEHLLEPLCTRTWHMSDDWHRGALLPDVDPAALSAAAERIAAGFRQAIDRHRAATAPSVYSYRPCHRIVLDLEPAGDPSSWTGIPLDARVVEGTADTSSYTLSLFRAHEGSARRTWRDLVDECGGPDATWRRDLDQNFADALAERLWSPSAEVIEVWQPDTARRRAYRPIVYSIDRRTRDDAPVRATIILAAAESADGPEDDVTGRRTPPS